jgi:hypothetical protein
MRSARLISTVWRALGIGPVPQGRAKTGLHAASRHGSLAYGALAVAASAAHSWSPLWLS